MVRAGWIGVASLSSVVVSIWAGRHRIGIELASDWVGP